MILEAVGNRLRLFRSPNDATRPPTINVISDAISSLSNAEAMFVQCSVCQVWIAPRTSSACQHLSRLRNEGPRDSTLDLPQANGHGCHLPAVVETR